MTNNVGANTPISAYHSEFSDSSDQSEQSRSLPQAALRFVRRLFSSCGSSSQTRADPYSTKERQISSPVQNSIDSRQITLLEVVTATPSLALRAKPDDRENPAAAEESPDARCLNSGAAGQSELPVGQLINSFGPLDSSGQQVQQYSAPMTETDTDALAPPKKPERDPRYIDTPLSQMEDTDP